MVGVVLRSAIVADTVGCLHCWRSVYALGVATG